MGKITILSKSSNNNYSYTDSEDSNLTANGNFELDEQEKRVLSATGNIFYNGMSIANFSTSMYNGVLQYQLYGTTADNTEKAFKALSGVQEQLKAQVADKEGTEAEPTTEGSGTGTAESASTAWVLRAKQRSNNLSHGSEPDLRPWRKKKEHERNKNRGEDRMEEPCAREYP